jgi:outer membrane protein assembly factor BamB
MTGVPAVLCLALSAPATAAGARLAVKPSVGPPTALVKASGSGFVAGERVVLSFDGLVMGSARANRRGKVAITMTIPQTARPGPHLVEEGGQTGGLDEQATFLVRTDWPQGCFESTRSCFDPYENVIGPGTVAGLAPIWHTHVGTDGSSAPVYANGKLFVGASDGLHALDPASGTIIINYHSEPVVTTPAVIRGFDPQPDPPGKVIFGSSDGVLHAVSTSGPALWQVPLGAMPASPLVIQGVGDPTIRIVVGAGDTLFAFDANGARLWATTLAGGGISTPAALLQAPPLPTRVVVAAGNTLYAIDAASGAVIWATTPSRNPLGAPAVGDPNILVGDQAGTLFSLDEASGRTLASFQARAPVAGSPAIGDPNLADPWVLLADGGGNIYAFDTTNEFPPPIWQAALGGPIDGPPVLANGVLYATTDPAIGDPSIFALDQVSGRVLFDAALPGAAPAGPILADGRLIVATRSGDVLAYEGPDSRAEESGDAGVQAAGNLFAVVREDGSLARGGSVSSSARVTTGDYEVRFTNDVTGCAYVASLGDSAGGSVSPGTASTSQRPGSPTTVVISTFDPAGTPADRPFHLQVACGATRYWAVVAGNGRTARAGHAGLATHLGVGAYQVVFDHSVKNCAYTASLGDPAGAAPPAGRIITARLAGDANGVSVRTFAANGTPTDVPFHLAATCGKRKIWTVVAAIGGPARGGHVHSVGHSAGSGVYDVSFDEAVSSCAYVATVGHEDQGLEPWAYISTSSTRDPLTVQVRVENADDSPTDRSFHLSVSC